MADYLQTWTEGVSSARKNAGRPFKFAASNQYPKIGLRPGDTIHIGYPRERRLHHIARLTVGAVVERREAVKRFDPGIWKATHYALAKGGTGDKQIFDLRVPTDIVRKLEFVRRSGERTNLVVASDGSLNGQALQAIRRLSGKSAELLSALREEEPGARRNTAHTQDQAAKRAVERYAMAWISEIYENAGFTVEDVSSFSPYDLECVRGDATHHVEVKGRQSVAGAVELTAGELDQMRGGEHVPVLAVVDEIELKGTTATGGRVRIFNPISIKQASWTPLRVLLSLPRGGYSDGVD